MTVLWVALAGSIGAVARFVADTALRERYPMRVPWPTMLVNVVGSLVLGVLTGLSLFHDAPPSVLLVGGVGFCGGFTTFSTTNVDTVRLIVQRRYRAATVVAVGTLATTVVAAAAGLGLTAAA
ncbi:CrcB family protein [Rhodococcus rhodochrous]|nr:CrcB family protein [Rhodococcus rhodochrous]MCD2098806.1 CrcB family protein [Rhodococcus rhodochrous]MCD2123316.1 CrcB family protein [Rhodococcus rhodochrous]MCQ4136048.1 CrcB family protein [Rhodococcus rhodochrous]MDJ0019970.1 CrcB family protein [Rhodococcus rhodochrous]